MKLLDLKKGDVVLIIALVFLSIAGFLYFSLMQVSGSVVTITLEGVLYETLALEEEQAVEIKDDKGAHINTVLISGGTCKMDFASCPDHLCVKQGEISYTHEAIVCLPNQVVVSIENTKETVEEIDSVSQ